MVLRVLSYNIRFGGVGREAAIAEVIRATGADVVVFQEATRAAGVARIAELAGLPTWAAKEGQSLAFASRGPVTEHAWHRPWRSRHAFLEVVPAGTNTRIIGLHLSAVHAAWTERRRLREMGALMAAIARHQAGLHLITGDFNTLAPDAPLDIWALPVRLRVLVWMSGGRIRWRTIQRVLDAGYVDGFRACHPSETGLTFPVWSPHVRLDYAFVPAAFLTHLRRCDVVREPPASAASDHYPLLTELDVPSLSGAA